MHVMGARIDFLRAHREAARRFQGDACNSRMAEGYPTHKVTKRVEGLSSGNIVPFSPMPFAEDSSVCISEFYELLKHGVCIEGHDVFVDVRQPKKPGARSLPCVLCPVVHWPVLLLEVHRSHVPRQLRASQRMDVGPYELELSESELDPESPHYCSIP